MKGTTKQKRVGTHAKQARKKALRPLARAVPGARFTAKQARDAVRAVKAESEA